MTTANQPAAMQLTRCPQCDAPAEIERRTVLESTDGLVEHAKVRCVLRHVFLMPTAALDHGATPVAGTASRLAPR